MTEIEQLTAAIAAQESLRPMLGDAVVDISVAALREKLAGLESPPDAAQRKLVTILFADVSGFTAMSETMDAEEVRDTMNALWEKLDAVILKHGGRVDKHIGDALMAIFGVPAAKEDDPERAVRAALGLQSELKSFAASAGRELKMRVGVNTGAALLGAVGSNSEFTAMGDAVNVASRLEHAAPIGGILISHDSYLHVRGIFDVETQEPLLVKGKKEPIRTYIVKGAKPRSFRLGTRGLDIETKMVGRDAELKALQDGMDTAFEDGEPQMRTVVGDAGMGKSRLLYEFTQWFELHPRRFWYFAGRASPETVNAPYGLLKDLFSQRFEIGDGDAVSAVHEKFERGVAAFLKDDPRAGEKAHYIGRLLGFDFSASPHIAALASNPALVRDRGVESVGELLRAAEAMSPVLLLLEDVHWADDASLDLISSLMARDRSRRLFILALTRPTMFERRPSWGEGLAGHRRVDLAVLSKRDSRKLVEDILSRVEALPETLREMVVNGSEGNPFYVEELIRMLMEDGVIDRSGEKWKVDSGKLAEAKVPATLVGVLQARLDSLGQADKEALQCASVVGRIFWDSSLAKLAPAGSSGVAVLERLRVKDMVFRREGSAFAGALEFIFKHALLRDVAYESVLIKQRKIFHLVAAEWLVEQSGERVAEFAVPIARHYELADVGEKAARYLEISAEKSGLIGAFGEAKASLTRALELLPPDLVSRRCAALRTLGKINMDASLYDESLPHFEASRRLAFEGGDELAQSRALNGISALTRRMGRYDEARARAAEALALARKLDARAEIAESLFQLGTVAFVIQDYASGKAQLEEALACLRESGDLLGQARCLNNLGNLLKRVDAKGESRLRYQESIVFYLKAGDKAGASVASSNLAQVLGDLGQFDEGRLIIKEALKYQGGLGLRRNVANGLDTLAELDEAEGRLDEARGGYLDSLSIGVELGLPPVVLTALAALARMHARAGRREDALALAALIAGHPAFGGETAIRVEETLRALKVAADDPEYGRAVAAARGSDLLAVARRLLAART